MPSPTIAILPALLRISPHAVQLLFRQQFGIDVCNSCLAGDRFRSAASIAGKHCERRNAEMFEGMNCLRSAVAHPVTQ